MVRNSGPCTVSQGFSGGCSRMASGLRLPPAWPGTAESASTSAHSCGWCPPWGASASLRMDTTLPKKKLECPHGMTASPRASCPGEPGISCNAPSDFSSEDTQCHLHPVLPQSHRPVLIQCGKGLQKGVKTKRRQSPGAISMETGYCTKRHSTATHF